jgi:transposase
MGRARYLVEAVVVEGRSISELARGHGVSRFWIYKLLAARFLLYARRGALGPRMGSPPSRVARGEAGRGRCLPGLWPPCG